MQQFSAARQKKKTKEGKRAYDFIKKENTNAPFCQKSP